MDNHLTPEEAKNTYRHINTSIAEEEYLTALGIYNSKIKEIKENCLHPVIAQVAKERMTYLRDLPEARICIDCYLKEDGIVYKKLKDKDNQIVLYTESRLEFDAFRGYSI